MPKHIDIQHNQREQEPPDWMDDAARWPREHRHWLQQRARWLRERAHQAAPQEAELGERGGVDPWMRWCAERATKRST